jgi:uncharacterized protein YgiM (DUF1202 family)
MQKIILIVLGVILIIGGTVYLWKSPLNKKNLSGLKIESTPTAQAFLDSKDLGSTPIDENDFQPGEYTVKLTSGSLSWENKIKLNANTKTYIRRDLGETDTSSGGVILTLEKSIGNKAEVEITSSPDGASVTLNGENKGTTPVIISDKSAGNYDLGISISGYKSQSIKIKITSGYKLSAMFELVKDEILPEATPSSSPISSPSGKPGSSASPKASATASQSASPKLNTTPPAKPYIQVLETPTNYLNVRSEPNKTAEILTKIYPTEYYSYIDEQGSGADLWYKISYATNKEGWISAQYAKKFE